MWENNNANYYSLNHNQVGKSDLAWCIMCNRQGRMRRPSMQHCSFLVQPTTLMSTRCSNSSQPRSSTCHGLWSAISPLENRLSISSLFILCIERTFPISGEVIKSYFQICFLWCIGERLRRKEPTSPSKNNILLLEQIQKEFETEEKTTWTFIHSKHTELRHTSWNQIILLWFISKSKEKKIYQWHIILQLEEDCYRALRGLLIKVIIKILHDRPGQQYSK